MHVYRKFKREDECVREEKTSACASTSDHNLGSATFSLFWNLFRDWSGKSIYHLIHCTGTVKSLLFKLNNFGFYPWPIAEPVTFGGETKHEYSLTVASGGERNIRTSAKWVLSPVTYRLRMACLLACISIYPDWCKFGFCMQRLLCKLTLLKTWITEKWNILICYSLIPIVKTWDLY
jgi:hypothetical protein